MLFQQQKLIHGRDLVSQERDRQLHYSTISSALLAFGGENFNHLVQRVTAYLIARELAEQETILREEEELLNTLDFLGGVLDRGASVSENGERLEPPYRVVIPNFDISQYLNAESLYKLVFAFDRNGSEYDMALIFFYEAQYGVLGCATSMRMPLYKNSAVGSPDYQGNRETGERLIQANLWDDESTSVVFVPVRKPPTDDFKLIEAWMRIYVADSMVGPWEGYEESPCFDDIDDLDKTDWWEGLLEV